MSCNVRFEQSIPGLMKAALDTNSVIGFQLAVSEKNYTGFTFEGFIEKILEYAEYIGFNLPFFLMADHITASSSSSSDIDSAVLCAKESINAGFTSVAMDGHKLTKDENVNFSSVIAPFLKKENIGYEVIMGEMEGPKGGLTRIDEAGDLVKALSLNNLLPDLIAISNGSKHGNYKKGEVAIVDLDLTLSISKMLREFGVSISQHGVTGIPVSVVGLFSSHGIHKANVGTLWQNIVHQSLPADLLESMQNWARLAEMPLKFATGAFRQELSNLSQSVLDDIDKLTYATACEYIEALNCSNTAFLLKELTADMTL
jgi:fructose/tagatose bisphosphate aldolase